MLRRCAPVPTRFAARRQGCRRSSGALQPPLATRYTVPCVKAESNDSLSPPRTRRPTDVERAASSRAACQTRILEEQWCANSAWGIWCPPILPHRGQRIARACTSCNWIGRISRSSRVSTRDCRDEDCRTVALAKKWVSFSAPLFNDVADELIGKYYRLEHEATRILAYANTAAFDAIVGCFDSKFTYWFIRPKQANPLITLAVGLPNHPSYPLHTRASLVPFKPYSPTHFRVSAGHLLHWRRKPACHGSLVGCIIASMERPVSHWAELRHAWRSSGAESNNNYSDGPSAPVHSALRASARFQHEQNTQQSPLFGRKRVWQAAHS